MTVTTQIKPAVLSKDSKARKKVEQGPRYVILFRVSVGQPFYRVLRNISTVNNGDLVEIKPSLMTEILDGAGSIPLSGIPRILQNQIIPFINGVKASLSEDYPCTTDESNDFINLNDENNILVARYENYGKENQKPVYVVPLVDFEGSEQELE